MNSERIEHFKRRLIELNKTAADCVIVVINVDDPDGGPLANALMLEQIGSNIAILVRRLLLEGWPIDQGFRNI